jgi:molybdopterin converting factor subunit 1
MKVQVLFFAQAREAAGVSQRELTLDDGARVEDAVAVLGCEHPALAPLWPGLAIAVSGRLARRDASLADGDEVALLPPVSGG